MRKQLAIGISVLALTALGGVSENNVSITWQGANPQYTHLVHTSLNQTFEPMSRAGFGLSLPNRKSFKTSSVQFITGGSNSPIEKVSKPHLFSLLPAGAILILAIWILATRRLSNAKKKATA